MLVKGIIESVADDGYSAKVRVPTIHRVATDPLGIPTDELDDATILSIPGVMPVYKINDVVYVQFEDDEIGKPVIVGLLERDSVIESSAKLSGETSIDLATSGWVSDELQKRDVRINEKMITSSLNSYPTVNTDRSGHWTVTIPNVYSIYEGLTIKVTISKDPYLIEGYNTLNVNGLGPQVVFYSRTSTYGNQDSILGQELFLTYHSSGLGPYTVINELGALPLGTVVTSGWVLSGGAGSFAQSQEYADLTTRINGLETKIDVKVGSYVGSEVPTLYNYPCNTWHGKEFITNIGVLYIMRSNGLAYRFVAEFTAQNLSEYPYGKTEGWIGTSEGVIFTLSNGVVNYSGTPTSTGSTVPHVSLHNSDNRVKLTAGTYTMIASTDATDDDIGMGVFLYDAEGNPYSGGGSGLLVNGYQALTTMLYDGVSWETAIESGYQKTITFTISQEAYAEYVILTTNTHAVEGNAKFFLFHSTSGFEWLELNQSEIQEILERLDIDEGLISEQGQDISTIQGQISSKIWNTDIAKVKVGGTNLLADTNVLGYTKQLASDDRYLSNTSVTQITGDFRLITDPPVVGIKYGYRMTVGEVTTNNRALVFRDSNLTLVPNTQYTLSVYVRVVFGDKARFRLAYANKAGTPFYATAAVTASQEWVKIYMTFTYTEAETATYQYDQIAPVGVYGDYLATVEFCGMKLEVGNKPTDWCDTPNYTYAINTKYSILEQTVEHIEAEVGDVRTQLTTKADNTVVQEIEARVTDVEITAEGLQSTVTHIQSEIVNVPWENLTPYPYTDTSPKTVSGIMWTVNEEDGSISASGTATADSIFTLRGDVSPNSVDPGAYVLHGCPEGGTLNTYMLRGTALGTGVESETFNDTGSGIQYTFEGARNRFMLQCVVKSGTTVTDLTFYPMFESGTVQHEYRNPMIGNAALSTRVTEAESTFTQTAEQLNTRVTNVETEMATVNWNNLLIYPYVTASGTLLNGITYTINDDSSVTATGTATSDSEFRFMAYTSENNLPTLKLESATYTLSGAKNSCRFVIDYLNQSGVVTILTLTTSSTTFNYDKETINPKYGLGMRLVVPQGTTLNNVTFYPMLEKGTIIHSYVDPKLCGESVNYRSTKNESQIIQEADRLDLRVDQLEEEVAETVWDNYVDYPYFDTAPITKLGITWTKNIDNSLTANGTATGKSEFIITDVATINPYGQTYLDPGTYTIHGCPSGGSSTKYHIYLSLHTDPSSEPSYEYFDIGEGITFITLRAYYLHLSLVVNQDAGAVSDLTFYPMLERGDQRHEYVNPEASNHGLSKRVTKAESTLSLHADEIEARVKTTDYNGNEIASRINQTSTTIDIEAEHINLTGAVTISDLSDPAKAVLAKSSTSKYQFYLSTSTEEPTGGSWSDASPTWVSGKYVWTRLVTTVTYTDESTQEKIGTAIYDKSLTDSLTKATTAQSTADTAVTKANAAQSTANSAFISVVPIYYRSTSTTAPSAPTSQVTRTDADTDNVWTLAHPKPKNARYYFTCNQCTKAQGTYYWSAVMSVNETNVTASWCNSTDSTYIDGSHLYTGTVTADAIAANTITSGKIADSAITAAKIKDGTITAAELASKTITATQIADGTIVTSLIGANQITSGKIAASAITSAKIATGAVTAGSIAASAITSAKIAAGAVTADSIAASAITSAKIAAGAVTADKIKVTDLQALGATIGGFKITTTNIEKYSADNLHVAGMYAPSTVKTNDIAFYVGSRTSTSSSMSYPFSIRYDGYLYASNVSITGTISTSALTASGGTIGGWNMNSFSIYSGSGTSSSPQSGMQMYSSTSMAFYAGWTGSDAAFKVMHSGALVATNVNIKGKVTATSGSFTGAVTATSGSFTGKIIAASGTIGSWTISDKAIYGGSGSAGTQCGMENTANWAFYAGYKSDGTYKFRVTQAGALTATNANITGTVYSSSGKIGGWTVTDHALWAQISGSVGTGLQIPSTSTTYGLAVGFTNSGDWSTAPFRVDHSGNGYITAPAGSAPFSGQHFSVSNAVNPSSAADSLSMWADRVSIVKRATNTHYSCDYTNDGTCMFQGSTTGRALRQQTQLHRDPNWNDGWYGISWWWDAYGNETIQINAKDEKGYAKSGWTTYSDGRAKNVKERISDNEAEALLTNVHPVNFTWKNRDDNVISSGFIAQDFKNVLKNTGIGYRDYLSIRTNCDGVDKERITNFDLDDEFVEYGLDYSYLTAILWKGWQMHEEEINELKNEIKTLKTKLQEEK